MLKKSLVLLLLITIAYCSSSISKKSLSKSNSSNSEKISEDKSIGDVIFGPIFGTLFVIAAIVLLWKNERAYVYNHKRLDDQKQKCVSISSEFIAPDNVHKLVHLTATTSSDEIIKDEDFLDISSSNSVKLCREVEMYQWVEESSGSGNSKTYTYKNKWNSEYIDSGSFHNYERRNPENGFYRKSQEILAKKVYFGAFFLSDEQKKMLSKKNEISLIHLEQNSNVNISSSLSNVIKVHDAKSKEVFASNGYIYIAESRHNTVVGDLRIKFFDVKCGDTTVVAEQIENTFKIHVIEGLEIENQANSENERTGINKLFAAPITSINWIFDEKISKDQAFEKKRQELDRAAFFRRILGCCFNCCGVFIFFSPIYYILSVVPLLGGLLHAIGVLVGAIFGCLVGSVISIVTMALGWLFYRPVITIIIILLSVGLGFGIAMI